MPVVDLAKSTSAPNKYEHLIPPDITVRVYVAYTSSMRQDPHRTHDHMCEARLGWGANLRSTPCTNVRSSAIFRASPRCGDGVVQNRARKWRSRWAKTFLF